MTDHLKFTFIVPVYEAPDSMRLPLIRCMDSLDAQTDKSFNVIFVHDGENDEVAKLVEKSNLPASFYSVPFRGIRGGPHCVDFALSLKECCGEFVCILNGDNILRPTYVEDMYTEKADILLCMVLHRDIGNLVTHGTSFSMGSIDRGNYAVRTTIAKWAGHRSLRLEQDWDFLTDCMAWRKGKVRYHHIEKILMEHF